ncbi:Protein argonaute [Lithohypha guttulata]|nr:Protein argonaute [Lithohypha guttulata]
MSSARRRGQARGQAPEANDPARRGMNPARGRVAPFDGPASRGSASGAGAQSQISGPAPGSRRGSNAGSQAGSQGGSQAPSAPVSSRPAMATAGLDPAREGPPARATDAIRFVDMPASFYNIDNMFDHVTEFAKRPSYNDTGKVIQLPLNSYEVTQIPRINIYQYDVIIGNGAETRAVQRRVWQSQVRKKNDKLGPDVIWDGNKLAWSMRPYGTVRMMVDLDVENGRPADKDGKNSFRIHINQTKTLNLAVLSAYIGGQMQFSNEVLEAINFLDHLMREGPSNNQTLVPLKASFFKCGGDFMDLGSSVEVFRGIFQSIRPAQGGRMVINLDVANTTFWKPQGLLETIIAKNSWRDPNQIVQQFQNRNQVSATEKYLKRLMVKAVYKGNIQPEKVYKIEKIANVNANTHRIKWRNPQTGQESNEMVSIAVYFNRRYNVQLRYPNIPLVQMTKKMRGSPVLFPAELLVLEKHQRYGAKLDENQTANMIKFAVSPPAKRLEAINQGKSWLGWDTDLMMRNYGLKISNQQLITQARVLPAPGVKFKNKVEQPGTKGRWDLRAKQFMTNNPTKLVSWGIGFFEGRTGFTQQSLEKFAMDFMAAYRGHGGDVANTKPHMMKLNNDPGVAVNDLYQATGNAFKQRPQILVFLVQNRNSQHYLRIKKSCDCRFGVVSQVMQAAQVAKGNAQYYSNVLMKFNAKLGGSTAQALPGKGSGTVNFTAPTVFIGCDVSHASPGSDQPSMAAITVSFDRFARRYAAGCQTNGRRVEMVTPANWRNVLKPLLQTWMSDVGGGQAPAQVYYIRDGVSERQFQHVMEQEVPEIRAILDDLSGRKWNGKITSIIAAKRHHIRAFPKSGDGDQKGNPLPGTLIERDVTSPMDFDFYLYSHTALQGTSRPVHYTVIQDEAAHKPSAIQNMIYEHCYQYMRSTTSVSLHPAAYYAHLASNRAKAHENITAAAGPQGGAGFKATGPASSDTPRSSEVPALLPFQTANGSGIQFSMWYI